MTHIEAIIKATENPRRQDSEFGPLWTNGYIAVRADSPGEPLESMRSLWRKVTEREDRLASAGRIAMERKLFVGSFVRCLSIDGVEVSWINEAFWLALSADGSEPWVAGPKDAVAFRRKTGELTGMAMPLTMESVTSLPPITPTDAEVFAAFACEANDFYLQSKADIRKRFADDLKELARELRRAREKLEELEGEIEELEDAEREAAARIRNLDATKESVSA